MNGAFAMVAAESKLPQSNGQEPASESGLPSDPELLAQGWVRRNLADPARAKEAMEIYASLGYEVRAERLRPDGFAPQCEGCALGACRDFVMIYTRKVPPESSPAE